MRPHYTHGNPLNKLWLTAALALIALVVLPVRASDHFDFVSGILQSPRFKGKKPLEKLMLAAELVQGNKLKQSDISFAVLDWADRYLREPKDPLDRLRRWAKLTNDENLRQMRIPRDFLNRLLLADYLVNRTPFLTVAPYNKLELLAKLNREKLVDWSVFLAYARIYAGGIIMNAKPEGPTPPLKALGSLKKLKDQGLIGWHYRVPTEALLAAEALAADKRYRKASPSQKLARLSELSSSGLISQLTRKELERLPAWRLLLSDGAFLKADPAVRKDRILSLKAENLISPSTASELISVFGPVPIASPVKAQPTPLPERIPPPKK
jgi:hypothetical protein